MRELQTEIFAVNIRVINHREVYEEFRENVLNLFYIQ